MSDNLSINVGVNSDDLVKAEERAKKLIATTDKVVTSLNQLQSAVLGEAASTQGVAALRKEILALGKEVGPVSETLSKHLGTSLDRLVKDAGTYRSIVANLGRELAKPGTFAAEAVKKMHADKTEMLLSMGQTLNSLKLGVQAIRNQTSAGIAEQAAAIAKSVDAAEDAGRRMKTAASSAASALAQENALTQRMIAAEGKITAERGKERLAGIRQDSAATLKQHKQAAAAERSALAQENALTRQMIAAEGKAEAERAKERLAGIRQESATLLAARKDSQKAQEDAIIREFKSLSALVTKGNADLLAARSKAAAGTLRPDIDLNRLEPVPNTLSAAQLYRANAGIQKFRADQAKPLTPAADLSPKAKDIDDLSTAFKRLTISGNDAHSMARGLASGFNLLWLTWGNLVPLMAGAGISFGVRGVVQMGSEVQHTMEIIRVLSEESKVSVQQLNDQMLELARTGPFGPKEVAEAMKTLSLAGLEASKVGIAIKDVMNFAVAGTTDLKTASDVMTSVATAFAVSAEGYNYVGDVIAKTAAVSKSSVESIGEAFKTASVIHKQYGVSLEDVGVGLAALSNLGIQGTAAGTALRNMYVDLSGRTPAVGKALKQLGLDLKDSNGNFKDIITLTKDLDGALSKLKAPSQKQALMDILSERGGKPVIELLDMVRTEAVKTGDTVTTKLEEMKAKIANAAGFMAISAAELALTPANQIKSVYATLQATLVETFRGLEPATVGISQQLKNMFNSPEFKQGLATMTELAFNFASGLAKLTGFLVENSKAVTLLGGAYLSLRVGLAASVALAPALAAAKAAVTGATVAETAAVVANTAASAANTATKGAGLAAVARFLPYVGTAVTVAAGAWLLYETLVGKSAKASADMAASTASDTLVGKLIEETKRLDENTEALLKNISVEELRASKGSKASSQGRVTAAERSYSDIQSEINKVQAQGRAGDATYLKQLQAEAVLRKQGIVDANEMLRLENRSVAVAKEGLAASATANSAAVKAKADKEAKLLADKFGKAGFGTDAGTKAQKLPTPYYDLKEFASNVAALGKAELDALKNSRTAKLAELKDYHDAGLLSIGNYEAQVISVTEAGYKAEAKKLEENLARELAELEAHEQKVLTFYGQRSEDIKKQFANDAKGQAEAQERLDDEVIDRLGANYTKQLAATAEFNTGKAKMRQDADDAERNATIKHAKDLMAIRAKVAEAIAASQDRVAGMREEAEVANRTAGLSGPELEAVQARLKVEIDGRKTLRTLDNALTTERQRATDILAVYERETDAETRLSQWEAYVDANEKINTLLDGRSKLEVTLGNEAAEAYALAYDKAFKKIADGIAENLSGGIVDALFTGGQEGAKKLRDTLKKELLMKPFQMVIQAMIQPYAKSVAGAITNTMYGNSAGGSGGMPSIPGLDNLLGGSGGGGLYGSFATSSLGQSLGLAEASWYGAEVGLTSLGQSIGDAVPYIGLAVAAISMLSEMDDSGTYHTGGVGGYSAAGGARTGAAAGVRFGVDAKDYTASAESAATAMAKGVVGLLDSTAAKFGKDAGYYAATAFADDTSADGAWGALMVKMGDRVLLDWGNNPSAQGDERVPRVFADGEAGAKEYAAAVAKDVKTLIDGMELPAWAESIVDSVAGTAPTMESLESALSQIAAMPAQILQNLGTSTEALAGILVTGMQKSDPQGAGQHFADLITYGIEASLYQGFASQVTGIISTQLITPVVTAMAAGATITEAMASVSIDTMKSQVAAAGATFSAMMNDPTFKTALSDLNTLIGTTVGGAIANLPPAPTAPAEYAAAAEEANQASEDLAQAAEDLAKRFKDSESALLDTQGSLNIDLLRAQGNEEAALAAERTAALAEYSEFSAVEQERLASLYDQNQAIRDQITAIEKAKEAFEGFWSAADSAADKFLSGDALKSFKLNRLATQINEAVGTSFDALDLDSISIDSLKQMVLAYSQNAKIAPEVRTAVMQLGDSLLDLKQSSLDAAKAIEQNFLAAADSAADKFLSGDALKSFKLNRLATQINEAVGTSFDALDLDSISIDSLKQMVLAYSQNAEIAPEVRTAVMQLGASLLDLKQSSLDAAKAIEQNFLAAADAVADKFLSGDSLKSFKLNRLATQINEAVGTSFDALDLDSISIDSLKQMVLAYSQNAEIAPEARIAFMQLGASLLDMKQAALDAADASAKVVTDERLGLERQLLELQGDTLALRALQLAATHESNRATLQNIWALQDQKTANEAAAAAAKVVTDERLGLERQLLELQGDTLALRALQLAATHESNRATLQNIWALQDQKTANEAAAAAAEKNAEALRTSTDNAYSALERAVAAQRKVIETQREAAQSLVQEVTAVFDTLKTNVADLFGEVEDARRFQAAQGRAFITSAITGAKAGAGLPDSKELGEAISAARAGLDDTVYASQAESDFQRLVLANELKALQSLSGDQLTEAERQLKLTEDQLTSLDATLETAKSQLDALRGIDTSVISVQAAIDRLGLAMAAEKVGAPAAVQAATEVASTVTNATAASTVTATKQPMTMAEQVASITASPTMSLSEQVAAMSAAGESNKQALQDYLSTYRTKIAGYSDAAKASIEVFMSALKGSMAQSQGVTDAAFVRSQVEFFGRTMPNVPAFDVGTNYVPRDMIAQIHEGEAIVPKAYNPAANGDGNERLENLVETLTAELRVLQAIVNTGNTHARRTADVLDNVTEGGSNMRTIAV